MALIVVWGGDWGHVLITPDEMPWHVLLGRKRSPRFRDKIIHVARELP